MPGTRPANRSKTRTEPRAALDRNAWIEAALDALANEGVAGLRVETLAKRMGVTKGSFYWHFRDRGALISALLGFWKEGRIRDILKQTAAAPGQERQRIYHVIEVYTASRSRKGMAIELAVRDWGRRDSEVARVVAEVDATRFEAGKRLFLNAGYTEHEAEKRSLLLYAYVFGQSLMLGDAGAEPERLKSEIADLIALP